MKKRNYRLNLRAVSQNETRERIVDAAIALHEELGPAATTISALADRAGVQRLTVYRHFQGEREIFEACSSKWLSQHPPPDFSRPMTGQPAQRTQARLWALYDYYSQNQGMLGSLYRDLGKVSAMDEVMARFELYLAAFGESVLGDWAPSKSKRLRSTVGHSLRFSTWESLAAQNLSQKAMAELVTSWIEVAAA